MSDLKIRLEGCNSVDDAIELVNSKFKGHCDYIMELSNKSENSANFKIHKEMGIKNFFNAYFYGDIKKDDKGCFIDYRLCYSPLVTQMIRIIKPLIIVVIIVSVFISGMTRNIAGVMTVIVWIVFVLALSVMLKQQNKIFDEILNYLKN